MTKREDCYGCQTMRHSCEHDNEPDVLTRLEDAIKECEKLRNHKDISGPEADLSAARQIIAEAQSELIRASGFVIEHTLRTDGGMV